MIKIFIALIVTFSTIDSSFTQTNSSFTFTFADGNYSLTTFTVNPSTIGFNITANTTGWIGLALSANPDDTSDVVIGGVKDGPNSPYVFDMHSLGNTPPMNDTKIASDWKLMQAFQDIGKNQTKLSYHRLLKTIDPNVGEDIEITMEGVYIIWSFWETDNINYRGIIKRGQSTNKEKIWNHETGGGFSLKGSSVFVFGTLALIAFKSF